VAEDAKTSGDAEALFGKTVDCHDAVHQLYHFLDGELTDERRAQIAEHLNYCAPCCGAAEFEAELRQVIANRCKDHVPEALIRRIAEAIDEESRQHGEQ
jgi:mycothiol system anti-sigma-R factor